MLKQILLNMYGRVKMFIIKKLCHSSKSEINVTTFIKEINKLIINRTNRNKHGDRFLFSCSIPIKFNCMYLQFCTLVY